VGHDPIVEEGRAKCVEPLFKGTHVVDCADLKGQVAQARLVCGKSPLTLLPKREDRHAILAQKHELPPRRLGLAEHREPKDLLIELLRAREIADIQTDMDVMQASGVARFDLAALLALKELRTALRGFFGALADGTTPASADIDVVNSVLHTGARALMLTSSGAVQAVYQAQPGADSMRFAIALSALRLVRDGERQRLHRCSNDRCVLLFYDTTKSATRRWCSLGCMDRARSAKRYRAAKQRSHS
jgi:predicted RNA-binding Zn ribbon-like protein